MKKILVIARPFTFHGGVERATAGFLTALVAHGYDVELLSFAGQPPVPGVTVHTLSLPPLPAPARALAVAAAAARFAGRDRWDIVQSHERTLRQHVYRAGEGCHRAYLASRARAGGRGLYHRVVLALERRVFARTPRIVAIARVGKREIETLYGVPPARVSVVYNGVDLERFHPANRRTQGADVRREVGFGARTFVVLFVGTGFERKGLATAVEGFAGLGDRDARLVVIGKGDTTRYRELAARLRVGGAVHWLEPRRDIERWYAAADVTVLPARYEPFGNVHLESLASGTPVVTSRQAGGSEVVGDGVSGAIVDAGDARQVTEALARVRAASPALREGARRAAEPYTYDAQVAGFARVYANFA
jgi:UDP-glucose:(heptosyl)LPS alpha-1,3-glucosyltransferase